MPWGESASSFDLVAASCLRSALAADRRSAPVHQVREVHNPHMSKTIPCGLLAFAAAASLLPGQETKQPAAGGWSSKPGGGLKYDGGEAFSLTWTNRIQVHWTFTNNEDALDTNTFNIRRARTGFTGHVFNKNI